MDLNLQVFPLFMLSKTDLLKTDYIIDLFIISCSLTIIMTIIVLKEMVNHIEKLKFANAEKDEIIAKLNKRLDKKNIYLKQINEELNAVYIDEDTMYNSIMKSSLR
jgi:hypothetical protein